MDIIEVPLGEGEVSGEGELVLVHVQVGAAVGWYEEPFDTC